VTPHDVLIAGAGIAAAAVASRLLDLGYNVLLLARSSPKRPGAEILPPEANAQIEALAWQAVFGAAGATTVEGFENCWNLDDPIVKPGLFLHVERAALARAALAFVAQRGASIRDVRTLPAPVTSSCWRCFVPAHPRSRRLWSYPRHSASPHAPDLPR
jgi:choline dehydrogenase-like flavoprotein